MTWRRRLSMVTWRLRLLAGGRWRLEVVSDGDVAYTVGGGGGEIVVGARCWR